MAAGGVSLTEFAAAREIRPKPWLETIPQFEECKAGYVAGVPATAIRDWLMTLYDEKDVSSLSSLRDVLRKHCGPRGG